MIHLYTLAQILVKDQRIAEKQHIPILYPTIYRTRIECDNRYTTDVAIFLCQIISDTINIQMKYKICI